VKKADDASIGYDWVEGYDRNMRQAPLLEAGGIKIEFDRDSGIWICPGGDDCGEHREEVRNVATFVLHSLRDVEWLCAQLQPVLAAGAKLREVLGSGAASDGVYETGGTALYDEMQEALEDWDRHVGKPES
jgi:hypothetical protein